jgi:hypothetical protein
MTNLKFNYKLQITNFTVMKKIFLAVLTAVAIVSCSTDNDNDVIDVPREKAFLNIGIKTPGEMRSSVGANENISDDQEIENFKAFVVDGDGTLKTGYSERGEVLNDTVAISVSTRAKRVYVIANAGNITLANESAILDYIADLNGNGSQSSVRWATGKVELATTDFVQNTQGNWIASKDIELVFIAARITLQIDNNMEDYLHTATDGSLVLTKVAVLNARGQSKLFGTGTSLIPTTEEPTYSVGKKFYEGLKNPVPSFFHYPGSGTFTVGSSLLSDTLVVATDLSKTYYYYVFENDAKMAADFPTIILVEGEYGKGDDRRPIYFPVHLAPYETWKSSSVETPEFIKRGKSYDITIKLSGDAGIGGGEYPGGTGGTDDPTNPVVSSLIDVSISVKAWEGIPLEKEFD